MLDLFFCFPPAENDCCFFDPLEPVPGAGIDAADAAATSNGVSDAMIKSVGKAMGMMTAMIRMESEVVMAMTVEMTTPARTILR